MAVSWLQRLTTMDTAEAVVAVPGRQRSKGKRGAAVITPTEVETIAAVEAAAAAAAAGEKNGTGHPVHGAPGCSRTCQGRGPRPPCACDDR